MRNRSAEFIGVPKSHGHAVNGKVSPTYGSWEAMRKRCKNPKEVSWKYYGAKGIRVCERWNKFENFLEDMGVRPDGKTLDRIDSSKNYEPSNCQWSDRSTQNKNKSYRLKTHCLRGHDYSIYVYVDKKGRRQCGECMRVRAK